MIETSDLLDSVMVYVDGGNYGSILGDSGHGMSGNTGRVTVLTVPVPYQDTCFQVSGVFGTGDYTQEGPQSNVLCIEGVGGPVSVSEGVVLGLPGVSWEGIDEFDNSNANGDPQGEVSRALGIGS